MTVASKAGEAAAEVNLEMGREFELPVALLLSSPNSVRRCR